MYGFTRDNPTLFPREIHHKNGLLVKSKDIYEADAALISIAYRTNVASNSLDVCFRPKGSYNGCHKPAEHSNLSIAIIDNSDRTIEVMEIVDEELRSMEMDLGQRGYTGKYSPISRF
jgi:hypothetical protein